MEKAFKFGKGDIVIAIHNSQTFTKGSDYIVMNTIKDHNIYGNSYELLSLGSGIKFTYPILFANERLIKCQNTNQK